MVCGSHHTCEVSKMVSFVSMTLAVLLVCTVCVHGGEWCISSFADSGNYTLGQNCEFDKNDRKECTFVLEEASYSYESTYSSMNDGSTETSKTYTQSYDKYYAAACISGGKSLVIEGSLEDGAPKFAISMTSSDSSYTGDTTSDSVDSTSYSYYTGDTKPTRFFVVSGSGTLTLKKIKLTGANADDEYYDYSTCYERSLCGSKFSEVTGGAFFVINKGSAINLYDSTLTSIHALHGSALAAYDKAVVSIYRTKIHANTVGYSNMNGNSGVAAITAGRDANVRLYESMVFKNTGGGLYCEKNATCSVFQRSAIFENNGNPVDLSNENPKGLFETDMTSFVFNPTTHCDSGKYSPMLSTSTLDGQPSSCEDCPKGRFGSTSLSGAGKLLDDNCPNLCPIGYYGKANGTLNQADACEVCANGKFGIALGATSETSGCNSVENCTKGYYCVSPPIPGACPSGKYNDQMGQTSSDACRICPVNSFSPTTGSALCTNCPSGRFTLQKTPHATIHDEEQDCRHVPVVTSIVPMYSPVVGGVLTTFHGHFFGFEGSMIAIHTNGNTWTNVVRISDTTIQAVSPAGSGVHMAVVTVDDGINSTTDTAIEYSYMPPNITNITQIPPIDGGELRLTGLNFKEVPVSRISVNIDVKACSQNFELCTGDRTSMCLKSRPT